MACRARAVAAFKGSGLLEFCIERNQNELELSPTVVKFPMMRKMLYRAKGAKGNLLVLTQPQARDCRTDRSLRYSEGLHCGKRSLSPGDHSALAGSARADDLVGRDEREGNVLQKPSRGDAKSPRAIGSPNERSRYRRSGRDVVCFRRN